MILSLRTRVSFLLRYTPCLFSMDGPTIVNVKRNERGSHDVNIIKLKRRDTADDVAFARLKDELDNDQGDGDADNEIDPNKDGAENETDIFGDGEIDNDVTENKPEDNKGEDGGEDAEEGADGGMDIKPKKHVSHGYHLVEGKMKHGMEDYLVAEKRNMDGKELGLYAIFDGHSGRSVAEYLQKHLFDNILNEPGFWKDPEAALKKVYASTNEDILTNVVGSRGGSTAVTAILIDRQKLVVANVGDSRAILSINGKAKPVTVDHEPLKEKEMVESKGGFVSQKPGNIPRVDGQLSMTRAFGDERVKDHITSEPDVFIENIDENTESIILASDGLWKVISNQDAVDCIRGVDNGQEAAEQLIREALIRDSKDDVSCVVVMFR